MDMPRFTPGPWEAVIRMRTGFPLVVKDSDGNDICYLAPAADGTDQRNALLIAASTRLFAACVAMLGTWGSDDEDAIIAARDAAREVVTKALGAASPG